VSFPTPEQKKKVHIDSWLPSVYVCDVHSSHKRTGRPPGKYIQVLKRIQK
jgi:hypothetical protein